MLTGYESIIALALINNDSDNAGNKHVEYCRNCRKPFVTDDSREFCSYDCQKTA